MTLLSLLLLYLSFRLKQVSCDYLLQTKWMAMGKVIPGRAGYPPLLAHAAIHGGGTLVVVLVFFPALWWLGPLDVFIHAVADRLKGLLVVGRKWTPHTWKYWWAFGLDQEVHNLTHLFYIVLIVLAHGGAGF